MINKTQFQRLLDMVMINLDPKQYEMMYNQMDQIIGFVDKLKELQDFPQTVLSPKGVDAQRDYPNISIGLSSNVEHPIANNMIQIKFWRGEK